MFAGRSASDTVPSFNTLLLAWKKHFPEVITPKTKRFSKCDICCSMDKIKEEEHCLRTKSGFAATLSTDEIKKRLQDIAERKSEKAAEYIKHIQLVERERNASNKAKEESRRDSENYLYFQVYMVYRITVGSSEFWDSVLTFSRLMAWIRRSFCYLISSEGQRRR